MITAIRHWLLRRIAGRDIVIINYHIDRSASAALHMVPGQKILVHNFSCSNWPVGGRWDPAESGVQL